METKSTIKLGFTTIEVLATSVLASLLMIATLGVIAGIAKKEKILEQQHSVPAWHLQLTRQLTADFRSAQNILRNGERLTLGVYGGDNSNAKPTDWLPAQVNYYPVVQDDTRLLLRNRELKIATGESHASQCVAMQALRLNLYPDLHDAQQNITQRNLDLALLPEGPLPNRFRAVLWGLADDKSFVVLYSQKFQL